MREAKRPDIRRQTENSRSNFACTAVSGVLSQPIPNSCSSRMINSRLQGLAKRQASSCSSRAFRISPDLQIHPRALDERFIEVVGVSQSLRLTRPYLRCGNAS